MENIDFATLFQGIGTMMESGWLLASARVFLVLCRTAHWATSFSTRCFRIRMT